MELGGGLDKVRMLKIMPGQNNSIMSALLGSSVQIRELCVWMAWTQQGWVGDISCPVRAVSCFAQHCWFKYYANLGDLIWSYGIDAL